MKQKSDKKDPLYKIKRCEWCERAKMLTVYHVNDYYKGWFCSECVEWSDEAARAVEKDRS